MQLEKGEKHFPVLTIYSVGNNVFVMKHTLTYCALKRELKLIKLLLCVLFCSTEIKCQIYCRNNACFCQINRYTVVKKYVFFSNRIIYI